MAVLISGDSLTALADSVRKAAGTTTLYTPSAMADQLNSLSAYRLWTRPEDMPQYDKYCKRFGRDVLYLTCAPTDGDSTVTFYVTTTDGGSYLVEYGSVDEDGFTATDSVTIASGTAFSDDLGTDSTYVVLRITAVTGGLSNLNFGNSSTASTVPVLEIWGRIENQTSSEYQYNNTRFLALDVLCGNGAGETLYQRYRHTNPSYPAVEYINVKNLDLSETTSLSKVFVCCPSLTVLDVSGWDTSSVTTLYQMFYGCSGLTALDLSGFDTSSVTTLYQMFYGCSGLTALDVSGWDTSSVTTLYQMFYGCSGLTALDVSGWDTSNVTTFFALFKDCSKLASITGISTWNTSKVTSMGGVAVYGVFYGCSALTELDLSGWDTSNVTNMYSFFAGCQKLTTLDISGFVINNGTTTTWMFLKCYALTNLTAPASIAQSIDLSTSSSLTVDSLNGVIAALYDFSDTDTTKTLTIGSTNLAKLTDDEIAVATAKGWTVA